MDLNYYTHSIENYILSFDSSKLTDDQLHQAKRLIIDFLASVLAGFSDERGKQFVKIVDSKISSVNDILDSKNISIQNQAYLLAGLSQIFDFNDGHSEAAQNHGCFHLGRVIIPVALSLGFHLKKSKEEIVSAIIIGYEIAGLIREPDLPIDSLSAFVVAARLLSLNSNQIRNGFGICAYLSPKKHNFIVGALYSTNYLNYAQDVKVAIESAELSQKEFTGPSLGKSLEKYKFKDQQISQIFQIYLKPYPSCRMTHPAIEASIFLKSTEKFKLDEIESIHIDQLPEGMYVCEFDFHKNLPDSFLYYDIKFLVALSLKKSKVHYYNLNQKTFLDDEIQNLISKIKIQSNPKYSKNYPQEHRGLVKIQLKSGKNLEKEIIYPWGHPQNPISDEDLFHKFNNKNDYERVRYLIEFFSK